jgi:type II secretory pathway component GspD/PulD (secretin)
LKPNFAVKGQNQNQTKTMKKTFLTLLAMTAGILIAQGQTNPPAPSQPAAVADISAPTNAPVDAAFKTPPATEPPAAVPATAPAGSAGIPLIQFSDVPITTAIENLARQAGINYMLDPKIGFGQADANGQVKAEPQLSIRWENITAEHALVALLDNYNLQLVRDGKTGIDRITPKDPLAPPPLVTRVIQLKYSSVTNMAEATQSAFTDKRSKVLSDARSSQLVVVATEPEQLAVDTLIASLDKPTRQVLIETKLVQISSNPTTKKGVDWSSTLNAQHVAFGNGSLSGTTVVKSPGDPTTGTGTPGGGYTPTTTPSSSSSTLLNLLQGNGGFSASTVSGLIPTTGFLTADGVSAVISFLNSTYDAQVVSTPRIVTLDNEMAKISVTRGYPIIQQTGGTQQSSGSSSITYSNVGTILQVTPRISANDHIRLTVAPEVSSHFGDITVTVPGGAGNPSTSYPVPVFDSRRIDSQVLIPNGNTLVMGGLIQDNPTASYTKVPLLGDIPGLGWAFRSESKSMSKDNLIIFLTPTIVKDDDFQPAPTDFLQSKAKNMMSPMNPHSMWDGSEPRTDWSNPAPVPGEFEKQNVSSSAKTY